MLVVWETHKHTLSLVIITLETKSEKVTVPISRAQHRTTRCCSVWSSSFLGGLGEPEKGGELQEGEEYIDPKDAAFQRQQEIIAARKRKLQPNYKERESHTDTEANVSQIAQRETRMHQILTWTCAWHCRL